MRSGVEPVGAAAITGNGDTGRVDHMGFDHTGVQPSRQPTAVTSRFVGNHNACDRSTDDKSFLAPAIQQASDYSHLDRVS